MKGTVQRSIVVLAGALLVVLLCSALTYSNGFQIKRSAQSGTAGETIAPANQVVLTAVGDVMLSRAVERQMIDKGDWTYPFLKTSDLTSKADLTFGNLETPILPGDTVPDGSFLFRSDPKSVAGLERAGFDVLSLANNHTMNFGRNGLEKTLSTLDAAGIAHAGAGLSDTDIYAPVIKEVKGNRIGFLAYSYAREQSFDQAGETYGTAFMDRKKMAAQVAALKQQVDIVVVSMHAGDEYSISPNDTQTQFARAAVDAGADLVIGHHPHVVQTFERYRDGYIIYSLGNFVFDQTWSEETRLGAVAEITIANRKIDKIEFVPVKTSGSGQPQPLADGEQARMIEARLQMRKE